ncbi:sensor histidine kinase [Cohnella cholangitidis]|uniref:histidine kinase n=1 Tax=Cohnella cholangitidis TaxID=2598458 RepID=A0A7G5BZM0_9BACL|nr:sensor histidine kinase [Cohnella cholangitidis]QMV42404.1 sensor histidine kinase [Cohnella cholangitidis]
MFRFRTSRTIRSRLFLIFLFCMLGLLLILSWVYYQRATEQIRGKVGVIAEKNISQTVGLFELMLKGYDSVTKSLNSNGELMKLLQDPSSDRTVEGVNLERRITDILGAIFYSRNDIVGIHIVTYRGKVYSFDRSVGAAVRAYPQEQWFTELKRSTGEMKWLGVYPDSLMSDNINRPVFAFGRQLFEFTALKRIGIVLIETDADSIVTALSNASLGPGSSVIIRGQDGNDIIRTNPTQDVTDTVPPEWPGALKDDEVILREREDALITAARISTADWTVIGITPKQDLKLELKETQRFIMTVIIVLVAAAIALATFISRSFSSPFKRLIQQMKQVELGNFKGQVHVQSYQELNVLVGSFNRMVHQMDELIERIKLASISEKNAQLKALQSQVNPHFLFNTLDMIYWMLDERENDRLGKVILALSQLFRYSSDWKEASRVPLRRELEQLRHYLSIIEVRLGGRAQTLIEVEERWLDIEVPKMILQPIIENAVKYGLEPLNRPGTLRIRSKAQDDNLTIIVEDNGVGIDEDTLDALSRSLSDSPLSDLGQETLADMSSDRAGIGLENVHRRIRLMFGDSYGIRVESNPNLGTTVIVTIPIPPERRN